VFHETAAHRSVPCALAVLACLITACTQTKDTITAPPAFDITPDCGHIYNPCKLNGINVVVRRQPSGPEEWPGGTACTNLPGGCFPQDGPVIIGPTVYYGWSGPPVRAKGTLYMGATIATGQKASEIQMAIRLITNYDDDVSHDLCQPIVNALLSKLNSGGIYVAPFTQTSASGVWKNDEAQAGTIYIRSDPGYNWNNDGNVDMRALRKTITEEGIHMYFDTDVGHGSGYTAEQQAAMDRMQTACGYWQ